MNVIRKPYSSYYRRRAPYRRRRFLTRRPRQPGISLYRYSPAKQDMETFHTIQSVTFDLTTDVAGNIIANIPFSTLTSVNNWSTFAALFDEFKVEALELEYIPALPNSTTATFAPVYLLYDSDGGPNITTVAQAQEYASVRIFRLDQSWKTMWTISSNLEQRIAWYDVAVPTQQTDRVALVAGGLSLSTTYGRISYKFYVKFKGTR